MLHILQWHRWLAGSGLPQGFSSYLARRTSPSPYPLPPLPFLHSISMWQLELDGETLSDEHATSGRRSSRRSRRGRPSASHTLSFSFLFIKGSPIMGHIFYSNLCLYMHVSCMFKFLS
jgi:hypothetical protein